MKLIRPVLGSIAILLITGLLLEGALRLFPQLIPIHWLLRFPAADRQKIARRVGLQTSVDRTYVPRRYGGHPYTNWVYLPGATITYDFRDPGTVRKVTMDNLGFCNPADSYSKDKIDLVVIGDSFAWCMTVQPEDTWTQHLRKKTGLSVYNLGLPARGVEEYVELLETYGLQKHPSYVVLMIYGGNDLRDALKNVTFRKESPPLESLVEPVAKEGASCYNPASTFCKFKARVEAFPLAGRSYAVHLALSGLTGLFWHRERRLGRFDNVNFRYDINFLQKGVVRFNPENADQDEVEFARRVQNGELTPGLFDQALKRFVRLSKTHHFVPIVVFCPSAYAAYQDSVTFHDSTISKMMQNYIRVQQRHLREKGNQFGYRFIDLTPHFQARGQRLGPEPLLFFPTNVHLTQMGHLIAADEILKSLPQTP